MSGRIGFHDAAEAERIVVIMIREASFRDFSPDGVFHWRPGGVAPVRAAEREARHRGGLSSETTRIPWTMLEGQAGLHRGSSWL